MSPDRLLARAAAARSNTRILLAGGTAERLHAAASRLGGAGFASVIVVGEGGLAPPSDPRLEPVAGLLRSGAPERVRDGIHALDLAADPLRFALGLCRLGGADLVAVGTGVRGADLADQAGWLFGPDARAGGSASWLLLADGRLVAFAPDGSTDETAPPSPVARARLSREVASRHAKLTGDGPRIAELPGFRDDADVLIFPDPVAAGIALRVTGGLAGALRIGPILLGAPGIGGGGEEQSTDAGGLAATAAALALMATVVGT